MTDLLRGLVAEATISRHRMWSVERFIARRKCGPDVSARLRRLNPSGVEEGSWPRGYHPHRRSAAARFDRDGVSVRDFVGKYGRAAFDALPAHALIKDGHRKSVTREYVQDHFYLQ